MTNVSSGTEVRITLNGDLGSGKSTVGKKLAATLGADYYSTGQLFRDLGRIRNLDALRTNLEAEHNSAIDEEVDNKIREIEQTHSRFILDSRMAWHFVPRALNIYLSVSLPSAAARVFSDTSRSTESYASYEEALVSLESRRSSEVSRYRRLYGVDIEDSKNYQLHIVSDGVTPDEIVSLILLFVSGATSHRYWMPKSRIAPLINIRDATGLSMPPVVHPSVVKPIPLFVDNNFGFYFGPAEQLVSAMQNESAFVPYIPERPGFFGEGFDVYEYSRKNFSASDFYDWEDALGVNFMFTAQLATRQDA